MTASDDANPVLDRDSYEAALPGLLEARRAGPDQEVDLGIIQCMVQTRRVPGLEAEVDNFIAEYGLHRENDVLALCEALELCENPARGLEVLQIGSFNHPDNVLFLYYRSMFLLRSGEFIAAKTGFGECVAQGFQDHGVIGGLAVCHFMLGDFAEALEVSRSRQDHQKDSANNIYVDAAYHHAINTGRDLLVGHATRIKLLDGGARIPATTTPLRIMVSGDSGYLRTYLDSFLHSVEQCAGPKCVHVHAILATEGDRNFLEDILDRYDGLELTCSYELQDETHTGKVYFAAARFLALHALCDSFGLQGGAYMMDMDSSVRGDLSSLTRLVAAQKAEIALRFRTEPFLEHRIAAGGVYLTGTETSNAFMRDVAAYIAYGLFLDKPYWYLDQLALLMVCDEWRRTSPGVRIGDLPREFLDWYGFDDSIVWTDKGGKDG